MNDKEIYEWIVQHSEKLEMNDVEKFITFANGEIAKSGDVGTGDTVEVYKDGKVLTKGIIVAVGEDNAIVKNNKYYDVIQISNIDLIRIVSKAEGVEELHKRIVIDDMRRLNREMDQRI